MANHAHRGKDKAEKAWLVVNNLNGRRREFFRQSAFAIWFRTGLE